MKRVSVILLVIVLMTFTYTALAAKAGEEVTVKVTVSSKSAAFAKLEYSYDSSVLEFVSASATSSDAQASPGGFSLANLSGIQNGQIGTITFRIKNNAPAGTYSLTFTVSDVFDYDENITTLMVSAESITVEASPTTPPADGPTTPPPADDIITPPPADDPTVPPEEDPICAHTNKTWKVTKPATCTAEGESQYVCDRCGEVLETKAVPALGHDEGEWVVVEKPTNTKAGLKQLRCTRCHEVLKEEVIDPVTTDWRFKQSVCSLGIRFRDIKPELTGKWYMFTPVDLSKNGTQNIDLIAANITYIGNATVEVSGDAVTVKHHVNWPAEKLDMAFTLLPDLDSVNSVDIQNLPVYTFGQPISISKDLNGDTNVLLYVLGHVNYDFKDAANELFVPNDARYQKLATELRDLMD